MDPGAFGFIPVIDRKRNYYIQLVEAEVAPFGQYPLSGIPEYLAVAMKKHADAILSSNPPPAAAHEHHTPSLLSLSIADVNYCLDCKLNQRIAIKVIILFYFKNISYNNIFFYFKILGTI